jgi:hypothetical protein
MSPSRLDTDSNELVALTDKTSVVWWDNGDNVGGGGSGGDGGDGGGEGALACSSSAITASFDGLSTALLAAAAAASGGKLFCCDTGGAVDVGSVERRTDPKRLGGRINDTWRGRVATGGGATAAAAAASGKIPGRGGTNVGRVAVVGGGGTAGDGTIPSRGGDSVVRVAVGGGGGTGDGKIPSRDSNASAVGGAGGGAVNVPSRGNNAAGTEWTICGDCTSARAP